MDTAKFLNAEFAPREQSIEVPELAEFFDGDDPVWTVRSVTAKELARAKSAAASQALEVKRALVQALTENGEASEKVDAIRDAIGVGESETPTDMAVRLDRLHIATVSPDLGQNARGVAVRLSEVQPVVFQKLTDAIYNLTGQGQEPGKRKRSGKTQKSST